MGNQTLAQDARPNGHARLLRALRTAMATSAVCLCLMLASPAFSANEARSFNIPAQSLANALLAYGTQSGIDVLTDSALVGNRASAPVIGTYTQEEALRRLLEGSGLKYEMLSDHTARVVASPKQQSSLKLPDLAPVPANARPLPVPPAMQVPEEVVVTGTRIRGVGPVGSEIVTLNRDQIEQTGRATTADVLRTLPQNLGLGADEGHTRGVQNAGQNVSWGSGPNLRGLGPDATLTLLNGRRLAPSGGATFIDISQIPLSALQRIEVLADGASAIYGSDAIGGVVNFVLRRDYEGVEVFGKYGSGDGFYQRTAGATLGKTWEGGSVVFSYEHYDRTNLPGSKRDYFTNDLRRFGGTDFRILNSNPGNISANGTTYAIPPGQNGRGLKSTSLVANTANLQDEYQGTDILPSQSRHSAVLSASQQLNDDLRVFVDGLYSRREFRQRLLPSTATLVVPSSNPFFVSPVAGARSVNVLYSFAQDYGAVEYYGPATSYSITGGAEYRVSDSWRINLFGSQSTSLVRQFTKNRPNSFLLNAALADSNPATAFNPFADGSATPVSTLDAVRGSSDSSDKFFEKTAGIQADGSLYHLPGGDLRLAVGAEYRHERAKSLTLISLVSPQPIVQSASEFYRRVTAAFGELLVPIVGAENAIPGIQNLQLSLAARGERYSDFGTTANPKIGARWTPTAGVDVRGSFGTSFKAPLLPQLNGAVRNFGIVTQADPKSATGSSTVLVLGGFNPSLQPETATTWSAGVDLQPMILPNLKLSGTYFSVTYDNRILPLSTAERVQALTQEAVYSSLVTRNPSAATILSYYADPLFTAAQVPPAQIAAIIDGRLRNIGSVEQSGVDLGASYEWDTDLGTITASANLVYLTRYVVKRSASAPGQDFLNTIGNPIDLRGRGGVAWKRDAWSASLFANYAGGYKNTSVTPTQSVGSWVTVDAQIGHTIDALERVWSGASVSLSVENILNERPPFVNNGTGRYGFDPENANALGRVITFSFNVKL